MGKGTPLQGPNLKLEATTLPHINTGIPQVLGKATTPASDCPRHGLETYIIKQCHESHLIMTLGKSTFRSDLLESISRLHEPAKKCCSPDRYF